MKAGFILTALGTVLSIGFCVVYYAENLENSNWIWLFQIGPILMIIGAFKFYNAMNDYFEDKARSSKKVLTIIHTQLTDIFVGICTFLILFLDVLLTLMIWIRFPCTLYHEPCT